MTHAELVRRAARWLRTTARCTVVLVEHHGGSRTVPDAIGWRGSYSVVVECKTSRSDFLRDRRKPSLTSYAERPGFKCYYLTEAGLLTPPDLPFGWGLLEVVATRWRTLVAKRVEARPDGPDDRTPDQLRREVLRLMLELRRYQSQGIRYETVRELVTRRENLRRLGREITRMRENPA